MYLNEPSKLGSFSPTAVTGDWLISDSYQKAKSF